MAVRVVKDGEDGHKTTSEEETRKIIFPYLRQPGKKYGCVNIDDTHSALC
jgi:hypothetical protein